MITTVMLVQYSALGNTGLPAVALIAILTVLFIVAGYFSGGPDASHRRTLAITTGLRNMSLAMVIATTAFAGTPVMTVVLASAVISGTLLLLFSAISGRMTG